MIVFLQKKYKTEDQLSFIETQKSKAKGLFKKNGDILL